MREAEKNPQKQPIAFPPNPERRKFLRNVLFAGALAPLACSRQPSEASMPITLIQNRPFQLGRISIMLTSCSEGAEFPSVSIDIYKKGASGPEHSVSMLVPSSFKFENGGLEYELHVESIQYGTPNSASAVLTKKESQAQNGGERHAETADFFTIGTGAAFLAAIFLAISGRKSRVPDDGLILPPKRNH